MYQAYWGLTQSPFCGHHDPRYFHQGQTQEEALARLQFLVDERRKLGLLLGLAGHGKTFLLETFARALGHVGRQTANFSLYSLSPREFLWNVTGQLGVEATTSVTDFKLGRALEDQILANRFQRIATILLLDDADDARPQVIDAILRLAQLDTSPECRLTIVLAAEPQDVHKLGHRLLDLVDLRIDLEAWELDDTAAFIRSSLVAAGRSSAIFSESALTRLHEMSGGIPRRVKQLADLALLAGAGQNLKQIESETIESSSSELGIERPVISLAAAWN